jgi:hypothetical protein
LLQRYGKIFEWQRKARKKWQLWVDCGGKGGHNIFRLGADAELSAPDAKAGTDVVTGAAALVFAVGALIDGIGNP